MPRKPRVLLDGIPLHIIQRGNNRSVCFSAVSSLMQQLGQRYVQCVNRVYKRRGTLWEGRFKSSLLASDQYLLACYRYIELNPVRAAMKTGL